MLFEKDRTFFCSELVAKAFKILGIIEDNKKSSAKYFPGNFTTKSESTLNVTKGTSIETELIVIVDRNDLINPNEADILPNDWYKFRRIRTAIAANVLWKLLQTKIFW